MVRAITLAEDPQKVIEFFEKTDDTKYPATKEEVMQVVSSCMPSDLNFIRYQRQIALPEVVSYDNVTLPTVMYC